MRKGAGPSGRQAWPESGCARWKLEAQLEGETASLPREVRGQVLCGSLGRGSLRGADSGPALCLDLCTACHRGGQPRPETRPERAASGELETTRAQRRPPAGSAGLTGDAEAAGTVLFPALSMLLRPGQLRGLRPFYSTVLGGATVTATSWDVTPWRLFSSPGVSCRHAAQGHLSTWAMHRVSWRSRCSWTRWWPGEVTATVSVSQHGAGSVFVWSWREGRHMPYPWLLLGKSLLCPGHRVPAAASELGSGGASVWLAPSACAPAPASAPHVCTWGPACGWNQASHGAVQPAGRGATHVTRGTRCQSTKPCARDQPRSSSRHPALKQFLSR